MTEHHPVHGGHRQGLPGDPHIPPRPKPEHSGRRRWIALGSLAVVVLLVIAWVRWIKPHQCGGHLYDRNLFRVGNQCIGTISAPGASFGPDVADIVDKIAEENEAVDRAVQQSQNTGWVRIAVAMPMTGSKPKGDEFTPIPNEDYDPWAVLPTGPIVHALHGAYVAQKRANSSDDFGSHNGVLVKLVLMNMGSQEESWTLLQPAIRELAQDTAHPLVAVVGLGVSRTETSEFAKWLSDPEPDSGRPRVPAIGGVLSAMNMPKGLFHVSPSDEDYVTQLDRYLPTLGRSGRRLRYVEAVDENGEERGGAMDLYVAGLHERFHEAFDARQIHFRGTTGEGEGHPVVFTQVTQDVCGPSSRGRPVVLFGGRPRDLQPLLDGLAGANCPNEPIVAAAATGIVVDAKMKDSLKQAKATLVFASAKNTDAWLEGGTVQRPEGFDDFVEAYRKELNPPENALGLALQDGYALSHHDAVAIAAFAVRNSPGATEESPPTGADVMIGLRNRNIEQTSIRVASGSLYFPDSSGASYACGRAIVISRVTGASPRPEQVVFTTSDLPGCQPQPEPR